MFEPVEDDGRYKYDESDQDFGEVKLLPWIYSKEQSIANLPDGVVVDFSYQKSESNNGHVVSGSTASGAIDAIVDGIGTEDTNAEPRNGTAITGRANSTEDFAASNYADVGEDAVAFNNVAMEILPGTLMNLCSCLGRTISK